MSDEEVGKPQGDAGVEKDGNDDKNAEEGELENEELNSEQATGVGTEGEQGNDIENLSDDMSDTGWDTDLEIEEEKEEYDPSGKATYLKMCTALGIVPASYFLRRIQSGESHIEMAHHGVGPKGAKAIALSLTSNTAITHLDLSDNGLQTEGSIAVTTMMKENCYITNLDLSDNYLGPPAAFAVAQMISVNSTLTHISLRGNGFDDKAAEPLAEIVKTSYHLKYVDLSHNKLGEKSGVVFGPAIADSETIQFLNLSWNYLRRKGAKAIAEGLKSNNALRTLNLGYNGFADDGVAAVADALKINSTLMELDVSNNRITEAGAVALSKIVPTHDSLQVLRMGKNNIPPQGLKVLLDGIKSSSSCSLQTLDFHAITITLDIEKLIEETKQSHTQLKVEHGGVGGFKPPKPLLPPLAKLDKYCKKENIRLEDLCFLFDKDKKKVLTEEEFRDALRHINAPLMEFERKKLMNQFKTLPEGVNEGEGKEDVPPLEEGEEEQPLFVDYVNMLETAKALQVQPVT